MNSSNKLLVISDLHLWGPEDPLYKAFIRLLNEKLLPGDKIFIVGDLFDLFIGSKKVFLNRYFELIKTLKNLATKEIEVFYLEGNHDFQIENLFDDCSHIRLYADSLNYEWHGKKLYFTHGDKINWKDLGYQFFRLVTRNLVTQCVIEAMPGSVIDKVGQTMARASRGYHVESNSQVVHMFRNYACEQISNGFDFVIMGHSHYFDDMRFKVEGHRGQYINVGYPRKHQRFFVLNENENFFSAVKWNDIIPLKPVK